MEMLNDGTDDHLQAKINGVDVYHPASGEIRSDETSGIGAGSWTRAYFLGASDPYKSLKTTLKAEINADA